MWRGGCSQDMWVYVGWVWRGEDKIDLKDDFKPSNTKWKEVCVCVCVWRTGVDRGIILRSPTWRNLIQGNEGMPFLCFRCPGCANNPCQQRWCYLQHKQTSLIACFNSLNIMLFSLLVCLFVFPGEKFINKLLNEFLFPASKLIFESTTNKVKVDPQADYNPK